MSMRTNRFAIGGWTLCPEGAVVHAASRTAVIADVHLGYEWARGAGGEMIPAHSLAETLARLEPILAAWPIERLVVAGDLVESHRPCPRTARDVAALRTWLAGRGIKLAALRGNHDPASGPATVRVAGWTIGHGDRPLSGARLIHGHHHPAFRFPGGVAPCFLVGPRRIVLPAFSPNAAGIDVASGRLPEALLAPELRCIAGLGGELFDLGPRQTLALRLSGR
jgi:putative SbcD/Mre11-related phosphoesterase